VTRHAGAIALIGTAAVCAIVPLPPEAVERVYSRQFYPAIQRIVTPVTSLVPIALLDIAVLAVIVALAGVFLVRVRQRGIAAAIGRTTLSLLGACAAIYLAFLVMWGLNYRRMPLESKLDYDKARVTHDAVLALANTAVAEVNARYAAAHATRFDMEGLEYAFGEAEIQLGSRSRTELAMPKHSLATVYFRRAAIDGMTDPVFLEIILNPEVLDVERPMVLAHEWGHLAGYADESEASFIAWLACVRGDALSQYSAWLATYEHAVRALSRQDRSAIQPLQAGPREDLRAIAARYERSSPVVRTAAQGVYDEYLRANRVREGIGSYDAVLRLIVGSRFEAGWKPVVRR